LRFAALDVVLGAIGGNVIAYCIMLTSAATLFVHHKSISTVIDAATALAPLLGPYAKYLFAIGFIGAGMVAMPVLLASTSYAVAGTFGWPGALSKKPWQNEGFYLILSSACRTTSWSNAWLPPPSIVPSSACHLLCARLLSHILLQCRLRR